MARLIPANSNRPRPIGHANLFQQGWVDTVPHQQVAVELFLHTVQQPSIPLYHHYVVFPPADLPGQVEAHRTGADDHDLHVRFTP
jgi:hypothetical protein